MRRGFEFMELAGIYDEFRLSAKGSQGLVHLFAPENRNVPVDTASHEKRGRGDVFHFVEKGQLVPYGVVFPGVAELSVIVELILIVAIEAGEFGGAGAGNRGFETLRLGDDEVRGDAPVGPAPDAELIGIGNALRYSVVHHGHVVLKILVAPISPDRLAIILAIAG